MTLPNAAADALFEGERRHTTFVHYLCTVFRWGGFLGWKRYPDRPEQELAFLREGLLPIRSRLPTCAAPFPWAWYHAWR